MYVFDYENVSEMRSVQELRGLDCTKMNVSTCWVIWERVEGPKPSVYIEKTDPKSQQSSKNWSTIMKKSLYCPIIPFKGVGGISR